MDIKHFLFIILFSTSTIAQVGIGTTTPSKGSSLEISGTIATDSGVKYVGLMPPRVENTLERDLINVNSSDIGLIVFVKSTGSIDMFNGIHWECVFTLTGYAIVAASQNFDTETGWTYTNTPNFYYDFLNDDIWGVITGFQDTNADNNIDTLYNQFLGARDLDNPISNPTGGTINFYHTIAFDNVDISGLTNVKIEFDYDAYQFNGSDQIRYTVYYDNVPQTTVVLLDGITGGITAEGTETITIPNGIATLIRLDLEVKIDGNDNYAGFDDFRVYGQ
ncbi:hypothetical protein SCB49_12754 [unidentified eubacterium SCB49]|nr:hypothetical protein SCB49_12754 [unidentified eubacterium SCB49]